tara:strand:- start:631 stop:849 length:219 start_codon:yes stop_codon:yes gene_type:complete
METIYFLLGIISLVALSYYLGYKSMTQSVVEHIVDDIFTELERDGIIRLIEEKGQTEIYSGNKFPPVSKTAK